MDPSLHIHPYKPHCRAFLSKKKKKKKTWYPLLDRSLLCQYLQRYANTQGIGIAVMAFGLGVHGVPYTSFVPRWRLCRSCCRGRGHSAAHPPSSSAHRQPESAGHGSSPAASAGGPGAAGPRRGLRPALASGSGFAWWLHPVSEREDRVEAGPWVPTRLGRKTGIRTHQLLDV